MKISFLGNITTTRWAANGCGSLQWQTNTYRTEYLSGVPLEPYQQLLKFESGTKNDNLHGCELRILLFVIKSHFGTIISDENIRIDRSMPLIWRDSTIYKLRLWFMSMTSLLHIPNVKRTFIQICFWHARKWKSILTNSISEYMNVSIHVFP